MADTDKKLWKWESFLLDHVRVMTRLPIILFAAPLFLTAQQMEAIQLAVSEINKSNIGKVWHKSLQRMAKLDSITGMEVFNSYGRSFGLSDGAGANTWALYDEILVGKSANTARAAESVAFMQMWMDLLGNTIGAFLRGTLTCNKREEQSVVFEILVTLYYFVEYVLMALATLIMSVMPANDIVYKLVYFIHAIVAACFIIPIGIIGLVALPIYIIAGLDASTLPNREGYTAVEGEDTYTVKFIKPFVDQKVGIRFGGNTSGQVVITNIRPDSIAATTQLQIGDVVLAINNRGVENIPPRQAATILKGSTGEITIEASTSDGTIVNDEDTV